MTTRTTESVLRGAGALCALSSAILHLMLVPSHLEEKPYIGILFLVGSLALIYVTLGLARHNPAPAWLVGALVSIGMIVGFTLSRTIGLPGGYRESDWEPPYGVLSMIAEIGFLLAFAAWLNARPAGTLTPPLPAKVPRADSTLISRGPRR
ncbi:hypothetical protein BX264_6536 [Streptomyces sp. 2333.5]|uniref:hypothetical protein n=1 Tax=unclassified Streptomyces TaxID=2593676 RepID=UPI000894E0A9|nr:MULTISPECIES: hypothetical protein [unclassified Streptomyces]PJJ06048.1 hypothetical protein BX264_6536 [Streptomyces sp. 2333.5]SEF06337.1 hypothetical protein SAMN05428942_6633 [Streptomyces sp. 2112.2]